MAELLTHVLVVYVVLTIVSWRVDWLDRGWISVAMGGAVLPDLVKLRLVVEPEVISSLFGVPFSYRALGTMGGVVVTAGLVTLLFDRRHWRRIYGLLVAGGALSILLDGLRMWADGRASTYLYPFLPTVRPPTPSLYVTADPRVTLLAVALAGLVFAADYARRNRSEGSFPFRTER